MPAIIIYIILFLAGCSPNAISPIESASKTTPIIIDESFISFDGTKLPLRTWFPDNEAETIFITLHGFNDYSNFIKDNASFFNHNGIGLYSYDQRGFGDAPLRGAWPGIQALLDDVKTLVPLVKKKHPDIPIYLLGDSMGGAVVILRYRKE